MSARRIASCAAAIAVASALFAGQAEAQRANWWQRVSAGFMGCRPTEVRLTEREEDNGVDSWIATCRGATFSCMWVRGSGAQCAPMRPPG